MRRCAVCCVVVAVTSLPALPVQTAAEPQSDPFATCRSRLADNPADYESAFCFFEVTRSQGLWEQGAHVFEGLIAAQPANAWLPLAYGHVYRSRDPARSERLYRQAADAFRASGNAEGELLARSNLRDFLFPLGRVTEAARELERVLEIGDAADDPLLKARAWSLQALHIHSAGGDLGHAFRLLKQAEAAVFPDGPYRLKRTTLNSLAMVAASAGRFDEAIVQFHRLDALATEAGEAQTQAIARYNLFNTTAMKEDLLPSPGGRPRLLKLAHDALEAGRRAQDQMVMVRSHSALAELLANTPGSRAAVRQHLQECLTLAAKARQPYDEAVCSWIEAALLQPDDPRTASAASTRALEATRRANNPRTDAYSAGRHMRFSWNTKSRREAVRDSLAAIDAVETLRALQDDGNSSAALFSAWTLDYYWLSGRLLQEGGDDDRVAGVLDHRTHAGTLAARHARSHASVARSPAPDGEAASGGARGDRRGSADAHESGAGRSAPARQPARPRDARAERAGGPAADGARPAGRTPSAAGVCDTRQGAVRPRRKRSPAVVPGRVVGDLRRRIRRRVVADCDDPEQPVGASPARSSPVVEHDPDLRRPASRRAGARGGRFRTPLRRAAGRGDRRLAARRDAARHHRRRRASPPALRGAARGA